LARPLYHPRRVRTTLGRRFAPERGQ
jgi:hypothetical protein